MNDLYGDGSEHLACEKCGFCITCRDCENYGCGKDYKPPFSYKTKKILTKFGFSGSQKSKGFLWRSKNYYLKLNKK